MNFNYETVRTDCLYKRLPTVNIAGVDDGGIRLLQQQLREKELRLTDVRLEALTSAHRLHQMRDAVKRLKASIITSIINYEINFFTKTTNSRSHRPLQRKQVDK